MATLVARKLLSGGGGPTLPYCDFTSDHGADGHADEMLQIMILVFFLALVWSFGRGFKLVKGSPLLGEIIAGVIVGPPLANFFDQAGLCKATSTFVLMGKIGVMLLIMEAGMHIQLKDLKDTGARAFGVAMIGTFLPVFAGVGLMAAMGSPIVLAVLAGCALAPTSLGMATKLLHEVHALETPIGKLIATAAVVDDIASLLILAELEVISSGGSGVDYVIPLVGAIAFIGVAGFLATIVFPKYLPIVLLKVPERNNLRKEFLLAALLFCNLLLSYFASFVTSHLLGAFLSGMMFASIPETPIVYHRQVKRLSHWLSRMFFSATIAFSVPLTSMMNPTAFGKGLALGAVAVGGKIAAGVFSPEPKQNFFKVGWAMVGRGEFAFIIAEALAKTDVTDDLTEDAINDAYGVLVWGLLLSSLVAPFGFRFVLYRSELKHLDFDSVGSPKAEDAGTENTGERGQSTDDHSTSQTTEVPPIAAHPATLMGGDRFGGVGEDRHPAGSEDSPVGSSDVTFNVEPDVNPPGDVEFSRPRMLSELPEDLEKYADGDSRTMGAPAGAAASGMPAPAPPRQGRFKTLKNFLTGSDDPAAANAGPPDTRFSLDSRPNQGRSSHSGLGRSTSAFAPGRRTGSVDRGGRRSIDSIMKPVATVSRLSSDITRVQARLRQSAERTHRPVPSTLFADIDDVSARARKVALHQNSGV